MRLFAPSEHQLHRMLDETLSQLHRLKALIQKQEGESHNVRTIHTRIDGINAHLRQALSIRDSHQKREFLRHLANTEKTMLEQQKKLARQLGVDVWEIIKLEKKALHAAKELEQAR